MMHGLEYAQMRPVVINITQNSGAGGDTAVSLEPAAGLLWVVQWARGSHNDVAARVCSWWVNDQVSAIQELREGASIASTVYVQLYNGMTAAPFVLQNGRTKLVFQGLALGGAKLVGISAMVYEYRAIGPST